MPLLTPQSCKPLLAKCALAAACLGLSASALAGDLVFAFTNPTFGGNPANGSSLLNIAGAQNTFTATPNAQASALDKFTTSLQSAMLSAVQSQITGALFNGKGTLPADGTQFTAGDYKVTVNTTPGSNTVTLTTLEISSGNTTVINVGTLPTQP